MITNKKNTNSSTKKAIQKKVDKIKLEAHVLAVENDKPINVLDKISSDSSLILESFKATTAWAKKNNLGKQTKQLLDTITDGIVLFLSNLDHKTKE